MLAAIDHGVTPSFILFSLEVDTMRKDIMQKQFWKYVLPSMFAMLLSGFYSIVDGLFVGNAVGNTALAAINIAYPIQVVLNASAIGIGIGGAVAMSWYRGKKQDALAEKAVGTSVSLLFLIGLSLPLFFRLFLPDLLHMLGAEQEVYDGAYAYIIVILTGGLLPVLGNGLNPLLRNHGKPVHATICMSSGLITNIILDYVLVFQWNMGLHGAALATIIAQGVVACSTFLFLWLSQIRHFPLHCFFPSVSLMKRILRVGISPFGQTLVPCIVIILTNWMCLKYGGNDAVTVFSVVSYVLASAQLLLQGIGDGVQPLLSFYHGAKEELIIHALYKKAFFLSIGCAMLLSAGVFLFSQPLTALFGVSSSIYEECRIALLITALSFPFIAITRLTSAVFYATGKAKNSSVLVYLEPCLLLPSCLLLLSSLFSLTGVWAAYPAAQILLSSFALILKSPNIVAHPAASKLQQPT